MFQYINIMLYITAEDCKKIWQIAFSWTCNIFGSYRVRKEVKDNEGNYIEEPIDEPADIIGKEATHTEKRSRSETEKLDYEQTAIINTIQAILNREVDVEIDLFFKSMAISVKKLPSRGKQEAKFQILTIISELERKYTERPAQPAQVLFQMPSQKIHHHHVSVLLRALLNHKDLNYMTCQQRMLLIIIVYLPIYK
ncbi:Uncharacterized protein FWK35_00032599, partial [Aphis craccivora]